MHTSSLRLLTVSGDTHEKIVQIRDKSNQNKLMTIYLEKEQKA